MQFGLNDEVIRRINSVFQRHPLVSEAILYGSRAKGTFNTGSDIDLTIKGDRIDLASLYSIERELDDLMLPYSFDLSLWSQIDNPDLLDHIDRVGVVFYRR